MDKVLQILGNSYAGSLVGILGITLAIFFYVRSRRKYGLSYQIDGITLIGGKGAAFPKEVQVLFDGHEVGQVTASRIVFWNSGDITIDKDDCVIGDMPKLQLDDGGEVLKVEILKTSRSVNDISVETVIPRRSSAEIQFEFLDPGDGAFIEVIHSGKKDGLKIQGTVKGAPDGFVNAGRGNWYVDKTWQTSGFGVLPFRSPPRFLAWVAIFVGGCVLLGAFAPVFERYRGNSVEPLVLYPGDSIFWPLLIAGLIYLIPAGVFLWSRRRRYPKGLTSLRNGDGE